MLKRITQNMTSSQFLFGLKTINEMMHIFDRAVTFCLCHHVHVIGQNVGLRKRWRWFTGGLRKKKRKNKKVNNNDDSQWVVWGRLPPAQLCLNLGLPTLRSVRVSVLSFHFIHLLHIFSFFLSLLFPYFLNFHIFSESHCLFLRESGKPKVLL